MTCCVDVNSRNPGNSWDAGGLESRQGGIGRYPGFPSHTKSHQQQDQQEQEEQQSYQP